VQASRAEQRAALVTEQTHAREEGGFSLAARRQQAAFYAKDEGAAAAIAGTIAAQRAELRNATDATDKGDLERTQYRNSRRSEQSLLRPRGYLQATDPLSETPRRTRRRSGRDESKASFQTHRSACRNSFSRAAAPFSSNPTMAVSILKSRVIQHAQCRFGLGLDTQIVEGYLLGGLDRTKNPFIQARDCPGIPQRGDRHPDDDKLSMQLLEPRPFKNSRDRIWALATYRAIDFDPINAPVIEQRATTKQVLRCYDSAATPSRSITRTSGNVYPSGRGRSATP
jgi:hypothetical protein